ncbi:MAG: sugar phosphate isomerase/epimerase, partial [Oscillospiraceae bacterium]|nr:sugar phosphate isomerase/epimerase [Oscillospiraceae bacterium]
MPQKLYPSAHILEMFMPYLHDEKRLIEVLRNIAEMGFYRNVELPTFPTKEHRDTVRRILRDNDLTAATYAAPYLNEREMSLCDLNDRRRAETIRYLKMQADLAAECGCSTFGVPSGPYPGDEFHDEAMAVQADTLARIADYTALLGMNCSIEPLDRYAHKKALIGPMDEVVRWFKPLHRAHPNLFLHWDSSHEQLGGLGIFNTLEMAAPYMSQIHLCDCIDDPAHPCFGDLHMDPAEAPD